MQGSWLGVGILILTLIWSLVFDTSIFQILAVNIDFEGAQNIHVLFLLIGALEDGGGSWLGLEILILIQIWSAVFETEADLVFWFCFWLFIGFMV